MYSFPYLEPVCCFMSCSNCCFLTCIQISQEADQVVWYSHLFKNFPQLLAVHTAKVFGIVNKAEVDIFLELSCIFDYPVDVGNLISDSSVFSKSSLNVWKFRVHLLLKSGLENFEHYSTSMWDECRACAPLQTRRSCTMVLEKTLENPLDCKEIQPVYPKGNQSWMFIGRTDAEAEAPILWPPDAKSWLIGKDPDAGKDWGQEEKGMTEDEVVGWQHQLERHGFGWTPGVGDGQGGLACCGSWGHSWTCLSDWTETETEMSAIVR